MILIASLILLKAFLSYAATTKYHNSRYFQTTASSASFKFENVSNTLNNLLKNYDIRLRPKFGSGTLDVDMEVKIASFDGISEVNMDYTITIYLYQYWRDERLVFGRDNEYLTLMGDFAEQIWVPDTFFANDKYAFLHDVTEKNKMIKIYGNGQIIYGMRFTTTLACMMDLHNYPLDSQNCTIEIESYGYTNSEVNICWKNGKGSVSGVDKAHLPQFRIVDYKTSTYLERTSTGYYTRLSLSFLLERYIAYFIFQTYLPSILIVMLSWVSFWINHEATSARVALGITTVLTMTTISTGVRSSLPRISYVKAIDIYLVTCFVFVFAALLEYAAVNYSYWSERAEKRKRINEILNENVEKYEGGDRRKSMIKLNLDSNISRKRSQPSPIKQHQQQQTTSFMPESEMSRYSPLPWLLKSSNNLQETALTSQDCVSNTNIDIVASSGRSSLANGGVIVGPVARSRSYRTNSKYNELKRRQQRQSSQVDQGDEVFEMYDPVRSRSIMTIDETMASSGERRGLSRRSGGNDQGRFWSSMKYKAKEIKKILPSLKDINAIDKYSRVIFPSLFMIFNVGYWCFYYVQSSNM